MGKNRDLFQILAIVIVGMFIPFLVSITFVFQVNIFVAKGWMKILSTFGMFLLVFGVELLAVFAYFHITNSLAERKLSQEQKKRRES